jgi:hypothetical protein
MTETFEAVGAIAVPRGCGERVSGGIYAECGFSPLGAPLEDFLMDPPIQIPAGLNLSAIGVQLVERTEPDGRSVWHIFDWVGECHYPNVADFLEELRRFGMSRRLPSTLDFSKITPESRHILVHARAWVENCAEYRKWICPQRIPHHAPGEDFQGCCAGVWWRDIEQRSFEGKLILREMPSFSYWGYSRPEGIEPEYRPAFFASFPISRIAVVQGEGAEEAKEAASTANLPVVEVER